MFRLIVILGFISTLSACVAYPAGYYAPGYAYGPDYVPAYGYGSVNIWGGGGGDYHGGYHRGYGHGYGHGGGYWEGGRGGGGHGGHGGGHGH